MDCDEVGDGACGRTDSPRAPVGSTLFLAVVTFLCLLASTASAQTAEELMDDLSEEEEARVIELIDDGQEAYQEGELRQALRHFNEVYRLFPHPNINYRVALIYDELDAQELAVQHYRQFLEFTPPDDPDRGEVEARVAEIDAELTAEPTGVRVETFPIGAQIYVEERETVAVGETPQDVQLPSGTHDIYVDKEGYEQVSETVEVEEGRMGLIQLELTEERTVDEGGGDEEGGGRGRWMPVAAVGLAGGGGLLLHQAFGYRSEYRDTGDEDARSMGITMGVVGGTMVAGAVVLSGWWLMRDRSPDRGVSIGPTRGDGVSVGVFGRF